MIGIRAVDIKVTHKINNVYAWWISYVHGMVLVDEKIHYSGS